MLSRAKLDAWTTRNPERRKLQTEITSHQAFHTVKGHKVDQRLMNYAGSWWLHPRIELWRYPHPMDFAWSCLPLQRFPNQFPPTVMKIQIHHFAEHQSIAAIHLSQLRCSFQILDLIPSFSMLMYMNCSYFLSSVNIVSTIAFSTASFASAIRINYEIRLLCALMGALKAAYVDPDLHSVSEAVISKNWNILTSSFHWFPWMKYRLRSIKRLVIVLRTECYF